MKLLIGKMRQYQDLTLMELSKETGISKSTLNDIENEKNSPRLDQLEAIANALKIKIEYLIEPDYIF